MRPPNEWFKPEQLRRYFYVYEAVALAIVLAVAGILAVTGILTAMNHHTAAGDVDDVEFPGMEERLLEFWASADEYWDAVDGGPERPY